MVRAVLVTMVDGSNEQVECTGAVVNDGILVLDRGGRIHVLYADGAWTRFQVVYDDH